MSGPILKLISFELCPFVERSRIVLREKAVAADVTFVDLRHKPDWFLALSPMGKVPVLVVDGRPIFESLVINELLEELYPSPRMMPEEPLSRAEARAWMIFAGDRLMPAGFKVQIAWAKGKSDEATSALPSVRAAFDALEKHLESRDGRYFSSDDFGLVDAAYAPFFRRWLVSETWSEVKLLKDYPGLYAYAQALHARPSVARAEVPELAEKLLRAFAEYA